MLKLIYTESSFAIESMVGTLETLIAQRVALALGLRKSFHVELAQVSFLVPYQDSTQTLLETSLTAEEQQRLTIAPIGVEFGVGFNVEFSEITVCGTWIAETATSAEGICLTSFRPLIESLLYQLWQGSESPSSELPVASLSC